MNTPRPRCFFHPFLSCSTSLLTYCLGLCLLVSNLTAADASPMPPPSPAPTASPASATLPTPSVDWTRFTYLETLDALTQTLTYDLRFVALSADGRRVIAETAAGQVAVWDLITGKLLVTLNDPFGVGLSADGSLAYTRDSLDQLHQWSVATGTQLNSVPLPVHGATIVRLLTDSRGLAQVPSTPQEIYSLELFDLQNGKSLAQHHFVKAHAANANRIVAIHSKMQFGGSYKAGLVEMDPVTGQATVPSVPVVLANRHDDPDKFQLLSLSDDGNRCAWIDERQGVGLYDFTTAQPLPSPPNCADAYAVDLNADGSTLFVVQSSNASYFQQPNATLDKVDVTTGLFLWRTATSPSVNQNPYDYYYGPDSRFRCHALPNGETFCWGAPHLTAILVGADGTVLTHILGQAALAFFLWNIHFGAQGHAVLIGDTNLERWGPDPDPPATNPDPETLVRLARAGLRHTLFEAVLTDTTETVAAKIRAHPAWVNECDPDGQTPLFYAVQIGRLDVVRLLLENGAKVNGVDAFEVTALVVAASARDAEMVALLEQHGARLPEPCQDLLVLLEFAPAQAGQRNEREILRQIAPVRLWSEQEQLEWIIERQRYHSPIRIRRAMGYYWWTGYRSYDEGYWDPVRAKYRRLAHVPTEWLFVIQVATLLWWLRRLRRVRVKVQADLVMLPPPPPEPKPAAIPNDPFPTFRALFRAVFPLPGKLLYELGLHPPGAHITPRPPATADSAWAIPSGDAAGLTIEQTQELTYWTATRPLGMAAILMAVFTGIPMALMPLAHWYWLTNEIAALALIPIALFVVWLALRWSWLACLRSFITLVGSLAGVVAIGYCLAGAYGVGNFLDPWYQGLIWLQAAGLLPMIWYLGRNLTRELKAAALERTKNRARRAPRFVHEEDLGAGGSWDERK